MKRVFIVLIIGFGMFVPDLLGQDAEPDLSEQAGRMIEHLVLESELGIRWEPSSVEAKRLQAVLDRPWEELTPLKASFARSDGEIVTTEALAWTILAEIAYARYLAARNSPEALVYLYLASLQVGFVREELLDPELGLYRPEWQDGEAYGEPALRDQLLMLWVLSHYSAIGDLLASEEEGKPENIRLFQRQIGPLADRIFRALRSELSETRPDQRDRILWVEALDAYRDAARDPELAREARRYQESLMSTSPSQVGLELAGERLTLAALADRLALLVSTGERYQGELEVLLGDPAVERLVGSGVPWPAAVAYDAASERWRVEDPTLETATAMAIAFRLLALRSGTPAGRETQSTDISAFDRIAQRLASLNEELIALEEQLESTPESQTDGDLPEGARAPAAPYPLTPWEAIVLGATVLVSAGTVLLARRGGPR